MADPNPYVCNLCGQRLEDRASRCNSGYHQSPENPNGFDGRAVRLSESEFLKPWNPNRSSWPRRKRLINDL